MIGGGTLFVGTLSLACSMQDVTPLLDNEEGATKAVTLTIENGRGTITGMEDMAVENGLLVHQRKDEILLVPITPREPENEIWGELRVDEAPSGYSLKWFEAETVGKKGERRAFTWSRGPCTSQSNGGVAEGLIQ